MGRYDKIKVYNNGSWVQPNQIRVYNNGWQDLGTNSSYNTKSLQVRKNNAFVRATLNRRDEQVVTDRWAEGRFKLLPASRYCRCSNNSSGTLRYNWYFRTTVEKTTDSEQYLFYCGTGGSPESPGKHYVRVTWQSNGKIRLDAAYDGNVKTLTSSNAVGKNTPVYLNVYSNAGSYNAYIVFNGVTTSGKVASSFMYNGCTTTVGDTYTKIRNNLAAAGVDGSKNTGSCSFNASYANGTDNSQYKGVTHRESTRTDVYWE